MLSCSRAKGLAVSLDRLVSARGQDLAQALPSTNHRARHFPALKTKEVSMPVDANRGFCPWHRRAQCNYWPFDSVSFLYFVSSLNVGDRYSLIVLQKMQRAPVVLIK